MAELAPPFVDSDEVLIVAEHVSKKFCRSLRGSLWYGLRDVASALVPSRSGRSDDAARAMHPPALRKDEFWAVQDLSFSLRRGECLGLLGHNGAGKSTVLKILNGLIPPDSGRITMRGRVAALIELNAGFNPILTGRENIYTQAALIGLTGEEIRSRFDDIVDFADIGEFLDMPVQNYSSGMRVRLGFAIAVNTDPDILIIDEVLAVGDVAFRFKCLNRIGEMMRTSAVVFVSHSMPQIFRICTEVIVMNHGRVTFQGPEISAGVSVYLSLFSESEESVTGSGEVCVEGLELMSGEERASLGETLKISFGAGLDIRARLRVSPDIPGGRLQFLLWNAEMLPVMEIMDKTLAGFEFETPESGLVEVSARIPMTGLNAGKYTLSVISATSDYLRVMCRHDNAAYLQVEAGTPSGAHVLSVADWSVKEVAIE